MSQYIGDDDADLKQLSEDPNYTPPQGSPTLAQQAAKSGAKQVNAPPKPAVKTAQAAPKGAIPTQSKSLSFLASAEGHLPALPVTLAVILLALGAGMAVYRASR
jgi:hypothetical protein